MTVTKNLGKTDRYTFAAEAFGFSIGVTSTWGNGMSETYNFNSSYAGTPRWIYFLWGPHHEMSTNDAAWLDAYTWPSATNDGTGGNLGLTNGYIASPACYGDVCAPSPL